MKKLTFAAILLLTAVQLVPAVQAQPRHPSPDALVRDLYNAHTHKRSPFFQTRSRALLYKYFVKSLADLIWTDQKNSKGEVGVIDGDPLYDAQDMQIKKFSIGKPTYENGNAQVVVSFENFSEKKTIVYLLVNGNTGWRTSTTVKGEPSAANSSQPLKNAQIGLTESDTRLAQLVLNERASLTRKNLAKGCEVYVSA